MGSGTDGAGNPPAGEAGITDRNGNPIRYADDFVFLSRDKEALKEILYRIAEFLNNNLKLSLHPDKVILKTYASGLDFLGWVNFPKHKVLRSTTRRRVVKKVSSKNLPSYLGLLNWGNTFNLRKSLFK